MTTGSLFKLDQLPPELVARIVFFVNRDDLKQLRLANKSLDAYAKRELFHSILLSSGWFILENWHSIVNSDHLRFLPRKVTIQPSESIDREEEWQGWDYDSRTNASFVKGLDTLESLPNVNSVQINFMPGCESKESDDYFSESSQDEESEDDRWTEPYQDTEQRAKILELIFGALQRRGADRKDAHVVRELTFLNLGKYPIDFASSDLFGSVMGQLEHLHIEMVTHFTQCELDGAYRYEEVRTFPPHFVSKWLGPISQNLRSLSLYSPIWQWGPFPGNYDLSGMMFPKLETLSLGLYTIAYDNQLDWILAQKSLKRLVMQECMIVSDIRFRKDSIGRWDVSTRDWEVVPGSEEESWAIMARYPGTWGQFFDKIAESLPNLETFCFDYPEDYHAEGYDYYDCSLSTRHLAELRVYRQRYGAFDEVRDHSRWSDAFPNDGKLRDTFWQDKSMVRNFHEDHLQEDEKSLERLAQKCRDRRGV